MKDLEKAFRKPRRSADVENSEAVESPDSIHIAKVFELNPQLMEIGSEEQYADYLKSVFPDSRSRDIAWHYSNALFKDEGFKPVKPNFDTLNSREGIYNFTTNREFAERYGANAYPVLLNTLHPIEDKNSGEYMNDIDEPLSKALFRIGKQTDDVMFAPEFDQSLQHTDGFINRIEGEGYIKSHPKSGREMGLPKQTVISVFDPAQIHILGSAKDRADFQKFVSL